MASVAAQATGTITIQKQLVDGGGNRVAADASGFQFVLTNVSAVTPIETRVTSNASGQATAHVAPGTYTIQEGSRAGTTLVSVSPGQSFVLAAGGTVNVTAVNRVSGASPTAQPPPPSPAPALASPAQTEAVQLVFGCNNVTLTWPDGTAVAEVAAAVSPTDALVAIWRFDAAARRFLGFAPQFPEVSDLRVVNRLAAVFVCVDQEATLTRPALGGAVTSPPPAPAPAGPAAARCADFPTQAAAQAAYRANPQGLANLDADQDGVACEANPCPCDTTPVGAPVAQPPPPPPPPASRCCRVCTSGQACGNSCIARNLTCRQPPGCACSAMGPADGGGVAVVRADGEEFTISMEDFETLIALGGDCPDDELVDVPQVLGG